MIDNQNVAKTYSIKTADSKTNNTSSSYGKHEHNAFKSQSFNNNQLLQLLLPLLLKLLIKIISNLNENNNNSQPKELDLTDKDLEDINQALYPPGLSSAAGLPSATGLIDNDFDGKISIGDTIKTTFTNPLTQEVITGEVVVDQDIIDRFNENTNKS